MKAEYYPKNQLWIVRVKDQEIKYPLEFVTVELVEYFAKKYDKIEKDTGWESLEEDEKKELLEWFEKEVFPTKEFGEFLINEIEKEALEILKEEEAKEVVSSVSINKLLLGIKKEFLPNLSDFFDLKELIKE